MCTQPRIRNLRGGAPGLGGKKKENSLGLLAQLGPRARALRDLLRHVEREHEAAQDEEPDEQHALHHAELVVREEVGHGGLYMALCAGKGRRESEHVASSAPRRKEGFCLLYIAWAVQ